MKKAFLIGIMVGLLVSCQKQTFNHADLQNLATWYSYSTVDWCDIDTAYYRSYLTEWAEKYAAYQIADFPQEIACEYGLRLQNAKTRFHQQTLPMRAGAGHQLRKQLNEAEATFDSIFVKIISQEYYMRLFVDVYEENMPQQIDACFDVITK